jgi:hypothetical protein
MHCSALHVSKDRLPYQPMLTIKPKHSYGVDAGISLGCFDTWFLGGLVNYGLIF